MIKSKIKRQRKRDKFKLNLKFATNVANQKKKK